MATRVKGAVILARRTLVQDEFGEDVWQQVLAALPEASRAQIDRVILSSSWYPFEVNDQIDGAIVRIVGKGDTAIFKTIGARSAKENLAGPHRGFLAPGEPQKFLAKTDVIYKFYYDQGYREYEETGPSSGVMTTHEAETFSATDCMTVIGWYEEALGMCGAKTVEMVEESCRARGDAVCRYRISFEM